MGKQKEINTKIKMEELSRGQKGCAYKRNPSKSTSLPLHPPRVCSRGGIHAKSIHLEVCTSQPGAETRWPSVETSFLSANDFVNQKMKPSE